MLLVSQIGFAQKKDENIGTEVVNVVKPYSATISDAFKVKETPSLDDDDNSKKEIEVTDLVKGQKSTEEKQETYFENLFQKTLLPFVALKAYVFGHQPKSHHQFGQHSSLHLLMLRRSRKAIRLFVFLKSRNLP